MQSVVSVRGQTVVPKEVREALGIKPGTKLRWRLNERSVVVFAEPEDPVLAMKGILKDSGYTWEDFMYERNEERKRELVRDEKENRHWPSTSSTPQP
jgi:AbrB family looped-hinge helix DNA binding protein